jgi:hypothetical protein
MIHTLQSGRQENCRLQTRAAVRAGIASLLAMA